MRVAVVQTQPAACAIGANLQAHETWVKKCAARGADMVFFSELSLLGYEPTHAARLAMRADDVRLDTLQLLSRALRVTIGAGAPTPSGAGVRISMLLFQPDAPRIVYSKQYLHVSELPYFVAGNGQVTLAGGAELVAPAICYESLLEEHCTAAVALGATVYVASVASTANGVAKADAHYPSIARRHSLPVLMANCVGAYHDFEAAGGSSIWNARGELAARLPSSGEGALMLDTATNETLAIA
jgi:predicted amidohydrolase